MRIFYDIIKTYNSIIKILQVVNNMTYGIMKVLPNISKHFFLVISKHVWYRQIWHDII